MTLHEKGEQERRVQEQVRAEGGHDWRSQLLDHYKTLHIDGPQDKPAIDIIQRALRMDGIEPRKRRVR